MKMRENPLQKKFEDEVEKFKSLQKDIQREHALRQKLDAQLNENKSVSDELGLVGSDAKVYKLVGPVLIRQDLEEAKNNVSKRMEYISNEIKRHEATLKSLEGKQETAREAIAKIQHQVQQAQVKAAMTAK
ncbi:unnamed protein product [Cyprideis torosa]|uniref:Probable prefoldin subunit 6 n=1 Tax=Cyprideis torosa TaxID=163714 RepID=A0A7R8WD16_9CRUS|nr:unnamed protein product [Cyprideis torosa]CAG0888091.1 unnamed protein product [Cyprideis torosa]